MAFADPQSITIDGTTSSLARVYTGTMKGAFVSADGMTSIGVKPTLRANSKRLQADLSVTKITSNPLITTTNIRVNDLVQLTIVRPNQGFSDDEIVKQVTGFIGWLTAGTNANLKKLVAGEN